jgi:deoxycytidylate deaminase
MLSKGYFRLARNTLPFSNCRVRVASVISRKSPIAVGFNIEKTHPRYSNPDESCTVSIHAEMVALIRAGFDVDGCDIYVYREANGMPALARPCNMCYNELKKFGIKKIYYSIGEAPFWKCEKLWT